MTVAYDQYNPTTRKRLAGRHRLPSREGRGSERLCLRRRPRSWAAIARGRVKAQNGTAPAARDNSITGLALTIGVLPALRPDAAVHLRRRYQEAEQRERRLKTLGRSGFIADYNLSKRTDVCPDDHRILEECGGLNFDTSAISFANGYFLGTGKNTMISAAVGAPHATSSERIALLLPRAPSGARFLLSVHASRSIWSIHPIRHLIIPTLQYA
ncbi:hypothetical protein ACU4GD_35410 [Cupriavidus basilensis]